MRIIRTIKFTKHNSFLLNQKKPFSKLFQQKFQALYSYLINKDKESESLSLLAYLLIEVYIQLLIIHFAQIY